MARLSEDNVRYIRRNPENKSGSDLAKQFKVTSAHISGIVKRKTWKGVE
jgi:DNA-binding MarR family transcriptional regulator